MKKKYLIFFCLCFTFYSCHHKFDQSYELSGQWEFYKGMYLLGDEFNTTKAISVKKYINYNTSWSDKSISQNNKNPFGYATYKLKVILLCSHANIILLRIPYFTAPVDIYVNNKKIHSTGKIGKTYDESIPIKFYPVMIPVNIDKNHFEIVIHISNFHYPFTDMSQNFIIGSNKTMMSFNDKLIAFEMFFIGIFLITIFYNIIVMIKVGLNRASLFFLFLCVASVSLFSVNGNVILGRIGLPWEKTFDIHYISWVFIMYFLVRYTFEFFDISDFKILKNILSTISIMLFIIIIILPVKIYSKIFSWDIYIFGILFVFLLYLAIQSTINKKVNSIPFLFSIVIFLLFFLNDIIGFYSISQFNLTLPAGLLVFSIFQSYLTGAKLKIIYEEIEKKDDLLIFQSRQASIGELMDFIAHQWKQNLYAISLHIESLKNIIQIEKKEQLKRTIQYIDKVNKSINHMTTTINEFRIFYTPNNKKATFNLASIIFDAINLINDLLTINNIEINLNIDEEIYLFGNSNKISQVIINILVNAQENFLLLSDEIKPIIEIRLYKNKNFIYFEIEDNGGGVQSGFEKLLFKKFNSTKNTGSGIGLYLSKMIIENNFKGSIKYQKGNNGAIFKMIFNNKT